MRRLSILVALALALVTAIPANATYNATATGTVGVIQQMSTSLTQYSAETVVFQLATGQPNVCSGGAYFVVSPVSMTDAQTRKNTIAMLLMAKVTGTSIEVAYDNTGGFCDQGFIGVYFLEVLQ